MGQRIELLMQSILALSLAPLSRMARVARLPSSNSICAHFPPVVTPSPTGVEGGAAGSVRPGQVWAFAFTKNTLLIAGNWSSDFCRWSLWSGLNTSEILP